MGTLSEKQPSMRRASGVVEEDTDENVCVEDGDGAASKLETANSDQPWLVTVSVRALLLMATAACSAARLKMARVLVSNKPPLLRPDKENVAVEDEGLSVKVVVDLWTTA
jgi:hypothetical protein